MLVVETTLFDESRTRAAQSLGEVEKSVEACPKVMPVKEPAAAGSMVRLKLKELNQSRESPMVQPVVMIPKSGL